MVEAIKLPEIEFMQPLELSPGHMFKPIEEFEPETTASPSQTPFLKTATETDPIRRAIFSKIYGQDVLITESFASPEGYLKRGLVAKK